MTDVAPSSHNSIESIDSETPVLSAKIEILSGSRRGEIESLPVPGHVRLGCADDCSVRFSPAHEPFVSAHHAEIHVNEDGVIISDTSSRNGTTVNGQAVANRSSLYCGDIIELGVNGPRLRFDGEGDPVVRRIAGRTTVVLKKNDAPSSPNDATRYKLQAFLLLILSVVIAFMTVLLMRERYSVQQQKDEIKALRSEVNSAKNVGPELVRQYGKAVYLIALRVRKRGFTVRDRLVPVGFLQPGGTAWAFDSKGRLATNAHVYRFAKELLEKYSPYVELVAVQNGTGKVFRVLEGVVHPQSENEENFTHLVSDVCVLRVDGHLPVVMNIADPQKLHSISSGESVYSIGFPIEQVGKLGVFYGYDTPDKVVATIRRGWVQRVTTADGRMGNPEESRLVHVGIAAVGGQSGSPVLTAEGKVVSLLLATGLYKVASSGRQLPHPGMFTYSVRADALLDLIGLQTTQDMNPIIEEPPVPGLPQ